ncbi:MAG: hypothetical protein HFJ05_09545 [Eubacterium sp.]|nr:hypothetical protein [Eubacterium sp.]
MARASARQNFDGDAVASSGLFIDAMMRNRQLETTISSRMEYGVRRHRLEGTVTIKYNRRHAPRK